MLCNVKVQSCGKNRIYSISGWKYFAKHSAATLGWWRNEWKVSWGRLFAVAKFNPTVFRSLCAIVLFLRFHYLCSGPTVKSFKMVLKWQKGRYVSTLVQCIEDFPSRVKKVRNKFVLDTRSRKPPLEKSVTWHALIWEEGRGSLKYTSLILKFTLASKLKDWDRSTEPVKRHSLLGYASPSSLRITLTKEWFSFKVLALKTLTFESLTKRNLCLTRRSLFLLSCTSPPKQHSSF